MLSNIRYLTFLGLLAVTHISADGDRFLAFPKDSTNSEQTNATDVAIKKLLGDNNVYSYVSPYDGVSFWLAPMTQDQQNKIKGFDGVSWSFVRSVGYVLTKFRSEALSTIARALLQTMLFSRVVRQPLVPRIRPVHFESEMGQLPIDRMP